MRPSEDQLEDKLNLFLWFPLPDSVGIDSITWKSCQCLSVYLAHFFFSKHNFHFALWPTHITLSTSTVVILVFCPSMSPCVWIPSPPLMLTSHIHYRVALAQSALFPSVVLNYSVFLGQALVSSHCNDFLIICLYVMNEMEMYHHGQTGLAPCQAATPRSG